MSKKPFALIIMDGWGYNTTKEFNAVENANTPVLDDLTKNYPFDHLVNLRPYQKQRLKY